MTTPALLALLGLLGANIALGLGNTVGYHRLLTHRAFHTHPWVRGLFTLLGALHSGGPLMWVGLHRLHHAKSDGPEDPHTPTRGFWFGHCGWLLGTERVLPSVLLAVSGFGQQATLLWLDIRRLTGHREADWHSMVPDLRKFRLMRILDVPLVTPALFGAQLAAAWLIGGWWGIAWLWALHVSLTNGSWSVNSICHSPRFGREDHKNRDQSRNVPWIAAITFGEGYHNNHHRFPRSACHGLDGGPDVSWWVIRLLERLGLAWKINLPRKYRHRLPSLAAP